MIVRGVYAVGNDDQAFAPFHLKLSSQVTLSLGQANDRVAVDGGVAFEPQIEAARNTVRPLKGKDMRRVINRRRRAAAAAGRGGQAAQKTGLRRMCMNDIRTQRFEQITQDTPAGPVGPQPNIAGQFDFVHVHAAGAPFRDVLLESFFAAVADNRTQREAIPRQPRKQQVQVPARATGG